MGALPPGVVIDAPSTGLPPGAVIDDPSKVGESVKAPKPIVSPYQPGATTKRLGQMVPSAVGITDFIAKSVPMAIGYPISGYAGMIQLALSLNPDQAADSVKRWQDFFTFAPGENAEKAMSAIAPPLSRADTKINDFAEEKATYIGDDGEEHIDPEVATAIKTGIWGGIETLMTVIPGGKQILQARKLLGMQKQVMAEAQRLGINIKLSDFADDLTAAGKLVGSESAGEAASEYVTALRNAEYLAGVKKNSLYLQGLNEKLFVSTSPVRKMGVDLAQKLHNKGYDLDAPEMSRVRDTLNDMHSRQLGFGSGQGLAVHFNQFELLHKRINRRIRAAKRAQDRGEEYSALMNIKSEIDEWMTGEFNNAAIQNGQIINSGGALSGDAAGFETYMAARKATQEHAWFTDTKVLADLIKKDTSVDQFAQWLIGSSAMGKRGSAAVVNKLKLLLGEDHPAIAAVRADFIYQLTKPLLARNMSSEESVAAARLFSKNYDKVLRENKPLVDALGLRQADVDALADFAVVATKLPASGQFYSFKETLATISRLAVGHSVAKGAARVTFMTKTLNWMTLAEAATPKQILGAMVDMRFDQPLLPKKSPVAASIIAAGTVTALTEED